MTDMRKNSFSLTPAALAISVALTGCGGGNPSVLDTPDSALPDEPSSPTSQSVSGGGVKGPLAFADVTVYKVDPTATDFKGAEVTSAMTDAQASISGLELPLPLTPPYIMEFTSSDATRDLTTDLPPVIKTLRTVITAEMF